MKRKISIKRNRKGMRNAEILPKDGLSEQTITTADDDYQALKAIGQG